MRRIDAAEWLPVGVGSLEDAAMSVVRSTGNTLVTAGPGSGKTELLAQRACYLLQTGTCPSPRRILAISFKRDAARNLADRVKLRCGPTAKRFESFTLDAFAKGLLDRFCGALPEDWRPSPEYDIAHKPPNTGVIRAWLSENAAPEGGRAPDLYAAGDDHVKRFYECFAHGHALPYSESTASPEEMWYGLRWWRSCLEAKRLSFPMISRLAAFVLRTNPKIVAAMRATYGFVFLDEFQDTTAAQYDLLRAAFQGSGSQLTAVGDTKQRIMLWAGAMEHVFDEFERDFDTTRWELIRNYRSAPALVTMQHQIARAIDTTSPVVQAAKGKEVHGTCHVLEFSNPDQEAQVLAAEIARDIRERGLQPRDFCVLVRQRTDAVIGDLVAALGQRELRLRDESQIQDILTEPVVDLLLWILRLVSRPRDPEAWTSLTSELARLHGWDQEDDHGSYRTHREIGRLLEHARGLVSAGLLRQSGDVEGAMEQLVRSMGETLLRSTYRQYAQGSLLGDTTRQFGEHLAIALANRGDLQQAVDDVIGRDIVPAMTIHKSKGLEFHTIVFIGLEDSSWWSFSKRRDEEKRAFFVAFSRAAERVLFTFSDFRNGEWGLRRQGKTGIGDLYAILQRAGVPTHDCRGGTWQGSGGPSTQACEASSAAPAAEAATREYPWTEHS